MHKKRAFVFLLLSTILILSLFLASAISFSDLFRAGKGKITGQVISDSDLIAHFKFDNTSDNEKLSGATASGNPTYVSGKSGNAVNLDGVDDYVQQNTLSTASISPTRGTFALWANFDSSILSDGKAHILIGAGNSNSNTNYISLRKVIEGNKLIMRYRIQGVVYDAGVSAAPLGWNHIVGTWNQTSVSLYVNGALNGQIAVPQSNIDLFNQFRIGTREFQTPLFYFKGQIDDVKVFNRDLTAQEVLELYDSYNAPTSCIDSDVSTQYPDGLNYYTKGTTKTYVNDQVFEEKVDICSGAILKEGYCYSDVPEADYKEYTCPNGCSDGACLPITSCSIWSDVVKAKVEELKLKGYQVGTLEGEVTKVLNYILINTGNGGSLFKTGATYSNNNITGIFLTDAISNVQYTATLNADKNGLFSINGQNYYAYPFKSGVTSLLKLTWGDGASYNNPGTATDSYVDCFGTIPSCYDSDKDETYPDGKNYNTNGYAVNEGSSQQNDSCSLEDQNILNEKICTQSSLDSLATISPFTCPNGCLEGACKPETLITYYDSYYADSNLVELGQNTNIQENIEVAETQLHLVPQTRTLTLTKPSGQTETITLTKEIYEGIKNCYDSWEGQRRCSFTYSGSYTPTELGITRSTAEGSSLSLYVVAEGYYTSNLFLTEDPRYSIYKYGYYNTYTNSIELQARYDPIDIEDEFSAGMFKFNSNEAAQAFLDSVLLELNEKALSSTDEVNGNKIYAFKHSSQDYIFFIWKSGSDMAYVGKYAYTGDDSINIQEFIDGLAGKSQKEFIPLSFYETPPLFQEISLWYINKYPSDLTEIICQSYWECETLPTLCPEYGKQTQTCRDISGCGKPNFVSENTCQPGACSGCYLPKAWEGGISKCVPFGFRLEMESQYTVELLSASDTSATLKVTNSAGASETRDITSISPIATINGLLIELISSDESNLQLSATILVDGNTFTLTTDNPTITTYLYGNAFCDVDGKTYQQKAVNGQCHNNFECASNQCSDNVCVGLVEEIRAQTSLLVKILCKLSNLFDEAGYQQCLAQYGSSSGGGSSGGSGGGGSA